MASLRSMQILLLISVAGVGCVNAAIRGQAASPIRHENIEVVSGELRLAAVITRPVQAGPHPGVVILHGAGMDRPDDYRVFADSLASQGIVVLVHESRILAALNGETESPSFHELSGDASAALQVLQTHEDVDPQKLGLWSLSRGGYTAPLTAVADPTVQFLIVISSPSLPVAFSDSSARMEMVRNAGVRAEDIPRAEQFLGILYRAARNGGSDYERLHEDFSRVNREPWFASLSIPVIPPEEDLVGYGRQLSYDPEALWRQVEVTTLLIYGDQDRPRLWRDSRARILAALSATGAQVEAPLYAGADHIIRVAQEGGELRFAEDFFSSQGRWLHQHVK